MKIGRLSLRNFGSHRETEIDFSKVNSSPIVIITGDTGSGKSTILDGITFALYQKIFRYNDKELRNIVGYYASEEEETYSELQFEINNEVYTVKRSITPRNSTTYSIEFKRGEIYKRDLKSNLDKVILDLLKVDYDLFVRAIVLPQGQFAALLKTDDPSERREIFSRVFWDLILYNGIKDKISDMLRNIQKEKENLEMILLGYVRSILDQIFKLKNEIEVYNFGNVLDFLNLFSNPDRVSEIPLDKLLYYKEEVIKKLKNYLDEMERDRAKKQKEMEVISNDIYSLMNTKKIIENLQKSYEELVNIKKKILGSYLVYSSGIDLKGVDDNEIVDEDLEVIRTLKFKFVNLNNDLNEKLRKIRESYNIYNQEEQKFDTLERTYESILTQLRQKGKEVRGKEFNDTEDLSGYIKFLSQKVEDLSKEVDYLDKEIEKQKEELERLRKYDTESEFKKIAEAEHLFLHIAKINEDVNKYKEEFNNVEREISSIEIQIEDVRKKKQYLEEKRLEHFIDLLRFRWSKGEYNICPICDREREHEVHINMISNTHDSFENFEKQLREVEEKFILLEKKKSEELSKKELLQKRIEEMLVEAEGKKKILYDLGFSSHDLLEEKKSEIKKLKDEIRNCEEKIKKLEFDFKLKQKEKNLNERSLESLKQLLSSIEETSKSVILPYKEELKKFMQDFRDRVKEFLDIGSYRKISDFFKSDIKSRLEKIVSDYEQKLKELNEFFNDLNIFEASYENYLSYRSTFKDIDISNLDSSIKMKESQYEKLSLEVKDIEKRIAEMNNKIGSILTIFDNIVENLNKFIDVYNEKVQKDNEYDVIYSLSSKFDINFINFVIKLKISELCDKANQYLDMLGISDKRIGVSFDTNNSLKFEVDYNGQRSNIVNSLSGGESFLFSISLALAVSKEVITGSNFKSIFIDEGFDTLDENFNVRLFSFLEQFANDIGVNIYVITHKQEISENTNYPKILVMRKGPFSEVIID
ncbi:MAG: AAA family ATPase [Brevinematia bacterium]